MVGYPNGLFDRTNNLPLLRRGITATHPAIDFNGKSETVIDAACFPGSSGSPVLIINEGGFNVKFNLTPGGSAIGMGPRIILLGILYAGPQINVNGTIDVMPIPTSASSGIIVNSLVMMHLGYVIKAKEVLVLCKHIVSNWMDKRWEMYFLDETE